MGQDNNTNHHIMTYSIEDLATFANAIPYAFLIINEDGIVTFANYLAQDIFFKERTTLSPTQPYKELIKPRKKEFLSFIENILDEKASISRQISDEKGIFLLVSKA